MNVGFGASILILSIVLGVWVVGCDEQRSAKPRENVSYYYTKSQREYLETAAKEPGVRKFRSGLLMRELRPGTGESPTPEDTVTVNYHGTLIHGSVFDSSVARGQPATFPLDKVIPCWTEALTHMKVGGKAFITCPPEIAYGDEGHPPNIRGGAVLNFEIELLGIAH